MTWSAFYLICFLVGFALSARPLFAGGAHVPLPHLHVHHGIHVPHGHGACGSHGSDLSPFNFGTIAAFLAWFGGTGYLLERYSSVWVYLGLFISAISGLGGASVVFWFLMKLVGQDRPLDPADYEMVGVLGRVASPIRPGGTGELMYS